MKSKNCANQALQPTARGAVDYRYFFAITKVSVSHTSFLAAAELNVGQK